MICVVFFVFVKNKYENSVIREGFLNMIKMLVFVLFLLLIGFVFVLDVFIVVVFGEKWFVVVLILNVLVIVGIFRVFMNLNGFVLLVKGRVDLVFYWDFGVLLLYGLLLFVVV